MKLVVGYGSIGQRHARLLAEMGGRVAVVSRRAIDGRECYGCLTEALAENPDYVVIANQTSEHGETLRALASAGYRGRVLVEKPLFGQLEDVPRHDFSVLAVGYQLRFHRLIQRLRRVLAGQKICSVQAYVGQYLPDWRPGRDYRRGYSASSAEGGGVLRDLSHEIDYLLWLCGSVRTVRALGGRFGGLEIDSDDCYGLLLATERCPLVMVQMNYLDRLGRRELIVNTEGHSYWLDLVNGGWREDSGSAETGVDDSDGVYRALHRAVLGEASDCCTAAEAVPVLKVIAAAAQEAGR